MVSIIINATPSITGYIRVYGMFNPGAIAGSSASVVLGGSFTRPAQ